MKFDISQPKWSDCHETESKHIDWPWSRPWILKVKHGVCYIFQLKMVRLPLNVMQAYGMNSRSQLWSLGLTLAVTFEILNSKWNFLYILRNLSNCHKTKIERIDWTLGPKCNYLFWPWSWHWPWNFNVKFWNSCITVMAGPIDVKRKRSKSIA